MRPQLQVETLTIFSISMTEWRRACDPRVEGLARTVKKYFSMTTPDPAGVTAINTYSPLYEEMNWATHSMCPARTIQEFAVHAKGVYKSGQQLYNDVKSMWNEMPHTLCHLS